MAEQQWYMAIGGHQVGPVSQADVVMSLTNGTISGDTLVFTAGMATWAPLKGVPAFTPFLTGADPAPAPPPIQGARSAHEIDFKILGHEM